MKYLYRTAASVQTNLARIMMFATALSVTGCAWNRRAMDSGPTTSAAAPSGPSVQTDHRLSLAEATAAVRQEVFRSNPKMNPAAEFPLRELTTPEIWERLHVQVFMVTDGVYEDESYLIDHGKTSLIGAGFGGAGITSLCVAGLAEDVRPELVFTYSFGSGIHRSMVGVWSAASGWSAADLALMNNDLFLVKVNDHTVRVEDGEFQLAGRTFKSAGEFGMVHHVAAPGKSTIEIIPNPDLPEKIKKQILR